MYSREIDDQVLTLAASGWTYRHTFVLYDWETESMWYHLEGTDQLTGIAGHYADRVLPELGATVTRWNQWKAQYPESGYMRYP